MFNKETSHECTLGNKLSRKEIPESFTAISTFTAHLRQSMALFSDDHHYKTCINNNHHKQVLPSFRSFK